MQTLSPVQDHPIGAWIDQPDPRKILQEVDPDIYNAIELERKRQNDGIELIASENYVFPAVLAAAGSVLTNKCRLSLSESWTGPSGWCVALATMILFQTCHNIFQK